MGDDLYLVDETGPGGTVQFEFSVADNGEILITATRNGHLPYLGSIGVGGDLSGVTGEQTVRAAMVRVSPNPVTGTATIAYERPRRTGLTVDGEVVIRVYDAAGRLVRELSPDDKTGGGSIAWDGKLEDGSPIPPGIYFARMIHGKENAVTKFVVLR
jgi:hypothetical protein